MTDQQVSPPSLPQAPIHERLGITVTSASAGEVIGTLPVKGNEQPFGALHGGASVVLAESLASIGSVLHAGKDHLVSGIEVNATHHRAATSGVVTGRALPLKLGRQIASWEVTMTDDQGRRTCTARVTCLITSRS
jgi:uncharacterized protein (TIGR00369 family)